VQRTANFRRTIFSHEAEAKKKNNTLHRYVVENCKPNAVETESGYIAADISVLNTSDTCVVCSVVSETTANNSSVEDGVY
jgi:D-Tyr-tRNAtyr deacylase